LLVRRLEGLRVDRGRGEGEADEPAGDPPAGACLGGPGLRGRSLHARELRLRDRHCPCSCRTGRVMRAATVGVNSSSSNSPASRHCRVLSRRPISSYTKLPTSMVISEGTMFFLSLYFQQVRGLSAAQTSAAF